MFNIDSNTIINDYGLIVDKLIELIKVWQRNVQPKMAKLRQCYDRELTDDIVINIQKYITDTITSYTFGEPVQYANISEDYINNMTKVDEDSHNIELAKDCSIYGRAYEYIFVNDEDMIDLCVLSPQNTFVIYSDDIVPKSLVGVYMTPSYDIEGRIDGYNVLAYTSDRSYKFKGKDIDSLYLVYEEVNLFNGVPILEVKNNAEVKSDFQDVIGLINSYEDLMSDRIHDKNAFINKLLVITNSSLGDTEEEFQQSKEILKDGGILELENEGDGAGATAQFISQSFNEADIEVLRKALLDDIFRQAKIPNLSDDSFGNSSSGISLKFKLYGTEMLASEKERYFKRHLRDRLAIINNIYTLQNKGMELADIDITMVRVIPVGLDEKLQELQGTEGILSLETRIARYDSEIDVEEEIKKLQEEKAQNMALMSEQFGNYAYNNEDNNDNDVEDE